MLQGMFDPVALMKLVPAHAIKHSSLYMLPQLHEVNTSLNAGLKCCGCILGSASSGKPVTHVADDAPQTASCRLA